MTQISTSNKFVSALLHLFFILFTLICFLPLVLVLSASFTEETVLLTSGYGLFPKVFSLESYKYLMKSADEVFRAYGLSIFTTIAGTVGGVLVIALFAYPISRQDFKYRRFFSLFVFFTMIFNGGIVPWYYMYSRVLGLKDTIWIYIIPHLMSAWYVMIMRTFFQTSVPVSLLESAKLDGASEMRIFFQIVMPLSKPGLASIALFLTVDMWNDYWIPLVFITKTKLYNIQYYMYTVLQNAQYLMKNSDKLGGLATSTIPLEGVRMALAIIGIGPIVLAYPFFQKYFVKGLTSGAIKE